MKQNTNTKKALPAKGKEPTLAIHIALSYIALLVLMVFAPAKLIRADVHNSIIESNSHAKFPTLIAVGRGELSWFGLSIYEASLWTPNGTFKNLESSIPVAFTITYERNIKSSALADRTVDEWEQLGIFDEGKRHFWGKQLEQIWPDVKPGDSITTLVTVDRKTVFYHNEYQLAAIEDPAFGTALLSIWLDAKTSEPELRAKLIGQKEDGHD